MTAHISRSMFKCWNTPHSGLFQRPLSGCCSIASEKPMVQAVIRKYSNSPSPKPRRNSIYPIQLSTEHFINSSKSALLIFGPLVVAKRELRELQRAISYLCAGKNGERLILKKDAPGTSRAFMVKVYPFLRSTNAPYSGVFREHPEITLLIQECLEAFFGALVLLNKKSIYYTSMRCYFSGLSSLTLHLFSVSKRGDPKNIIHKEGEI